MGDRSDDRFAAELLGTDVLVDVTMVDHAGRVKERRQFYDQVVQASAGDGVTVVDPTWLTKWIVTPPKRH